MDRLRERRSRANAFQHREVMPVGAVVSIVILNYNGKHFLEESIQSALLQTYPSTEVVLVDNHSTDGSVEFVKSRFPEVRIVQNDANLGFAEGNNRGANAAKGELLLFLNNDARLEPDAVERAVECLRDERDVGAVALKLRLTAFPERLNSAGGRCDIFGFAEDIGLNEVDNGQYDRTREPFFACGAALLVRGSAFREAGGFDARFFIYYEDVDLCWRLRILGYRVAFVPAAVVFHRYGGTVPRRTLRRYGLVERNRLTAMLSNWGYPALSFIAVVYAYLKAMEILALALTGQSQVASTLLRSVGQTARNLPYVREKRRKTQSHRRVSDKDIFRCMEFRSLEIRRFLTEEVRFER